MRGLHFSSWVHSSGWPTFIFDFFLCTSHKQVKYGFQRLLWCCISAISTMVQEKTMMQMTICCNCVCSSSLCCIRAGLHSATPAARLGYLCQLVGIWAKRTWKWRAISWEHHKDFAAPPFLKLCFWCGLVEQTHDGVHLDVLSFLP